MCLAWNLSSDIVKTESNIGRVGKAKAISIGVSSITTIEESGISISITLAVVTKTISISIGSISLSGSIKSLSDWVKTSAGSKRNSVGIWVTSISSVEKSRVSISITLTLTSTRDRDVSSINTGSTHQAKSIAEGIRIASNSSDKVLGGASGTGNKGGSYSQEFHF